jgi:hypothetical protein
MPKRLAQNKKRLAERRTLKCKLPMGVQRGVISIAVLMAQLGNIFVQQ